MSAHPPDAAVSTSPPILDSSTRNLLDNFLDQKKKEKALFERLKSRSASTSTANTGTNNASPSSSASSITPRRRRKNQKTDSANRNVLDLLPRGRSGDGAHGVGEEEEEDESSLIAQAEALADLERLNGVEPSIPISTLRIENSNDISSYGGDENDVDASDKRQPYQMDVDEVRRYFGESWQLSQFWYSSEFAYHLARCLYGLLENQDAQTTAQAAENHKAETAPEVPKPSKQTKRIAFLCSPTAYVAFRYLYPETSPDVDDTGDGRDIGLYLFDFDERLSLVTPPQHVLPNPGMSERFVHYDLNKLLSFPSVLEKQLDMVIIVPPYLNAVTNLNIAQIVRKLLKSEEEGKVLLITGRSMAEQACDIYGNETTGPLRRAEKLEVEHIGLKNEFGAWGNWDGV